MEGGSIHTIVDQAQALLVKSSEPIFCRGRGLVRPVRLGAREAEKLSEGGVKREPGSLVQLPITAYWLVRAMARTIKFFQQFAKQRSQIDPPDRVALHIIDNTGGWPFPSRASGSSRGKASIQLIRGCGY